MTRARLEYVAQPEQLAAAWADVMASDAEDGILGAGVSRFAEDSGQNLAELGASLMAGTYETGVLTPVAIPRPDGRLRTLHIPAVRDRIVERAVLTALTPVIDPLLGPFSYAYRPGLGVADAVQAVAALREEGLGWVARTDFHDCFGSLPVPVLRRMLPALIEDPGLLALITALLGRRSAARGAAAVVQGVPQGSPLSPLWANLVLAAFDTRVVRAGFPLIRYADDMAALAASSDDAWEAMRVMNAAASELGMALAPEKSEVMSFDEGFTFLGEDFGPRYPPVLDGHRVENPERRVVYLGLQGSHARLEAGRLIVESHDDRELLNVPSGSVQRVVCFGSVGVSAGLRSWALATGVEQVFISRRGSYLGHTLPASSDPRLARIRAQLAFADDEARRLPFARAVVSAKIAKQVTLLKRFARRENAESVLTRAGQMDHLATMLPDCSTRDELMGIEGASAREYFAALTDFLPDGMQFAGRSTRPPADTVNSALSYGYAILLGEAVSALCAAGLDPGIGLLHTEQERRPSLALDLMEEFRPLIVDQVVIAAARKAELRPEHGRREESIHGVLLTKAGKEVLVSHYERRMLQHTRGALPGISGSLRRHLYRQAERIAACIGDPGLTWTGLSWR